MGLRYLVLVQLYNKEGLGELSFFHYLIENRFHKNTLFDQLKKDRKHLAQFVPKVAKIRVFSSDSSSEKKTHLYTQPYIASILKRKHWNCRRILWDENENLSLETACRV